MSRTIALTSPSALTFQRPHTLATTVADHIREEIFRGRLLPGAPLHEVEISKTLHISRGTVREALRSLQEGSLVEIVPRQGAFVTRLGPRRAKEIYTLRALLEPYAVRLAMERGAYRPGDLDELDALVRRLGALEQNDQRDVFEIVLADMEFHRVMCARSGHGALIDVLQDLQVQTRLFILHTMLYHSDIEKDEHTHRAILDAIRSGIPARAEEMVRTHITNAGSFLVARIETPGDRMPAAP
jgi:DNA-binding GntR family transcriptional regulator